MMKLVPAKDGKDDDGRNFTENEKKAVVKLLERAEQVSPGIQIRFVQRDVTPSKTMLLVGVRTKNLSAPENFELYSITYELDDPFGIELTLTGNSHITGGMQLLRLRASLPADKIAPDAKEPPSFHNPFWTKGHERYRGILLFGLPMSIITVVVMNYAYFPMLFWAQKHYPNIFPSGDYMRTSHQQQIELTQIEQSTDSEQGVAAVKRKIDNSLSDIDARLSVSFAHGLTEFEVNELKREKAALEKAKRDLDGE